MSIVKIKTIIIAHKMDAKIIIRFSDIETEKKKKMIAINILFQTIWLLITY